MVEKPKIKIAEAEESLRKAAFIFNVDQKTLIHKTTVYPKLVQWKICLNIKQKKRAPGSFFPVLTELTEPFGLMFASDEIVIVKG